MSTEHWLEFWQAHGRNTATADEQTQVLRTFNKEPITEERWKFTLADLDAHFPVGPTDDVLDLCCGNGLFTAHLASRCHSVTSVDISADLLTALDQRELANVRTIHSDMRKARFRDGEFSRIILYAAVQYLTDGETVELFQQLSKWLRPGGQLFVGDVPDRDRLWAFYNTPERQALYFANRVIDRDVVGTWFEGEWMTRLATTCGFSQARVIEQHPDLIYAHFRFDMHATK